MTKKHKYILIAIIILLAAGAFYLYWTKLYLPGQEKKVYTAADFPQALERMDEKILQISLDDLNKQYQKLEEGDHIYIRWINIGILKKRFGDYANAEKAWQNAISYNPDQSLAFGNLADLYLFDLREYEKAEEYYRKVLTMKSYNFNYYIGLATLYRYEMTEKTHLIEDLMLDGAKLNRADAGDYYLYLAVYFSQGPENQGGNNQQKAKHYSEKTLEANPDLKDQLPEL